MSASPLRAALYLRVSTARQAEHDVSIPDQRRQGEAYCAARGYDLVETYIEPGASATNDRRPEFQRMMEAGTTKPAAFDVVVVHSFSRFFRDHFELEFYVRKLAKNGVRLVSMTQELGDDPMHVMMRQIMALFDEYQSKENAKHTLRALKENARQGFWNGSLPPVGYRVVDAEKRGAKIKKMLEIDPLHADTVRLMFKLALEGDGTSGRMGVKAIAAHLNARKLYTRTGGRWGVGTVHRILTRRTYIGGHEFNKHSKAKTLKPQSEMITGRGAAADRPGDLRRGPGAAQVAQPDGRAGAGRQRADAAHRHLLLRRLRRRDDAAHLGQGQALPLLHLLDRRAAGRDRLQGPHGPDAANSIIWWRPTWKSDCSTRNGWATCSPSISTGARSARRAAAPSPRNWPTALRPPRRG